MPATAVRRTTDLDVAGLAGVRGLLDQASDGDLADAERHTDPDAPPHLASSTRVPAPGPVPLDRRGEPTCDRREGDVW